MDRATCKSTCPAGTFEQGASVTGRTCVVCLSDCAACADASTCQTCENSKYLSVDSTSCPTACPTKTYGNGAGITGRKCENCIAGCSLCTGGSTCEGCTAPLLLDQGTCASSCGDGYVFVHEKERPITLPNIMYCCVVCVYATSESVSVFVFTIDGRYDQPVNPNTNRSANVRGFSLLLPPGCTRTAECVSHVARTAYCARRPSPATLVGTTSSLPWIALHANRRARPGRLNRERR